MIIYSIPVVQFHLKPFITYPSQVNWWQGQTCVARNSFPCGQDIIPEVIKIIGSNFKFTVKQLHVYPDICFTLFFPTYIIIAQSSWGYPWLSGWTFPKIITTAGNGIYFIIQVTVSCYLITPHCTIRTPEFQIIDYFDIVLKERFFANVPSTGYGRKKSEPVFRFESV
ncbi:hypothetical protein D3C85_973330 [compost metagenome]